MNSEQLIENERGDPELCSKNRPKITNCFGLTRSRNHPSAANSITLRAGGGAFSSSTSHVLGWGGAVRAPFEARGTFFDFGCLVSISGCLMNNFRNS